jgi:transposase
MPRPKRPAGPPRAKRFFTAEFKAEAVRLLRARQAEGATLAAVSRELDVGADQLRLWERRDGPPGQSPRATESEAEELRRLRRENAVLKQEREFLKKATAFFAKESR